MSWNIQEYGYYLYTNIEVDGFIQGTVTSVDLVFKEGFETNSLGKEGELHNTKAMPQTLRDSPSCSHHPQNTEDQPLHVHTIPQTLRINPFMFTPAP